MSRDPQAKPWNPQIYEVPINKEHEEEPDYLYVASSDRKNGRENINSWNSRAYDVTGNQNAWNPDSYETSFLKENDGNEPHWNPQFYDIDDVRVGQMYNGIGRCPQQRTVRKNSALDYSDSHRVFPQGDGPNSRSYELPVININHGTQETDVDDINDPHVEETLSPNFDIPDTLTIFKQNIVRRNLHIIIPVTLLLAGTIAFLVYWFTRDTSSEGNTTMSPLGNNTTTTDQNIATTMSTIFDAATTTASNTLSAITTTTSNTFSTAATTTSNALSTITTTISDILSSITSTLSSSTMSSATSSTSVFNSTTRSPFSSSSSFFSTLRIPNSTSTTHAITTTKLPTSSTTILSACCQALKVDVDGGSCPPVLNSCDLFGHLWDCSCSVRTFFVETCNFPPPIGRGCIAHKGPSCNDFESYIPVTSTYRSYC